MKLILMHGSAVDAILKKTAQIKKEFDPLSITEGLDKSANIDSFSQSLFSEKRLIVLDNPDLKTIEQATIIADPQITVLIKFLKPLEKSSPIYKKIIELKGEVLVFDESQEISIFPFLDMLGNLNKSSFKEFEKVYSEFGGQYILVMLAYFLRRMIQKPKSVSSFMQQKLAAQKKNFDLEKIKSLYKELIETDFKIKQGLIEEKLGVTMLVQKFFN